jgi:biopolymer transport protein ExbD
MAMGSLDNSDNELNPEINTTPLVDVMLVLLVIFIITIPVVNNAVKIDLPRAAASVEDSKPAHINLAINEAGQILWDEQLINEQELHTRLSVAAKAQVMPEIHLRAERTTPYEKVAQVMAAAQMAGLQKIGFVTEPEK